MTNEISDKKLFLIHAGEGGVLFYKDFADELKSTCSVYGIEAPWMMSEDTTAASLEEVATGYLELIQEVQPTGPYMLAGYCYGGIVAFEMASQLLAAGESDSTLILFDAPNPMDPPRRYGAYERLKINLNMMEGLSVSEQLALVSSRAIGKVGANFRRSKEQFVDRCGRISKRIIGKESEESKALHARQFHHKLSNQYKPRPYDGSMVLIEGMIRELYDYPDKLGWSSIVKGEIRNYQFPAEHLTMLKHPMAAKVAEVIANEISSPVH